MGQSNITELVKQDDAAGTGNEAVAGRQVSVHYTGWLYDPARARSQRTEIRQLARSQRAVCVSTRRRASHPGLGSGSRGDEGRRQAHADDPAATWIRQPGRRRRHPTKRDSALRGRAARRQIAEFREDVVTDLADVDIESIALDGNGVARIGRTPLTVPFTIPGERVRVRLGAIHAGARSASLVEVLRPSPHRVEPACRHFGPQADGGRTCGSCSWQHIAYPEQLQTQDRPRHATRSSESAFSASGASRCSPPHRQRSLALSTQGPLRRRTHALWGRLSWGTTRAFLVASSPSGSARSTTSAGTPSAFALCDACQRADTRDGEGHCCSCWPYQ